MTENDSNKVFTPKGALNLFNTLTTNFTNGINAVKEVLRLDIVKKLNKGAYSGDAQDLKNEIDTKEPIIEKRTGFNLNKTDLIENDNNMILTPKGAFDLKTWLITNYTTLMNNIRENLINLIDGKLSHGGYSGTGQELKNEFEEMGRQIKSLGATSYVDFVVGGDPNTYYGVQINLNGGSFPFWTFSISRGYNWSGPDSWNTETHRGGLTLTMQWSNDGSWGGNDHSLRVIQFSEQYTTLVARVELLKIGVVVWLRGGGALYRLNSETGISSQATVHLGDFIDRDDVGYSPIFSRDEGIVQASILRRYPVRDEGSLYINNNLVYYPDNKPSAEDIGALSSTSALLPGIDNTITYGIVGLQFAQFSGIGGDGTSGQITKNPYDDWFHHIILNHANSAGYYSDFAFAFHNDDYRIRRVVEGVDQGWKRFNLRGNPDLLWSGAHYMDSREVLSLTNIDFNDYQAICLYVSCEPSPAVDSNLAGQMICPTAEYGAVSYSWLDLTGHDWCGAYLINNYQIQPYAGAGVWILRVVGMR